MAYDDPALNKSNPAFRTTSEVLKGYGKGYAGGTSTGSSSSSTPKPQLLTTEANFQSMSGATWYVSGTAAQNNLVQRQVTPPTVYTAGGSQKSASEILASLLPSTTTQGVGFKQPGVIIPAGALDQGIAAFAAGQAGMKLGYDSSIQGQLLSQANAAGLNATQGTGTSSFDWQKIAVIGIAAIAGVALIGKVLK